MELLTNFNSNELSTIILRKLFKMINITTLLITILILFYMINLVFEREDEEQKVRITNFSNRPLNSKKTKTKIKRAITFLFASCWMLTLGYYIFLNLEFIKFNIFAIENTKKIFLYTLLKFILKVLVKIFFNVFLTLFCVWGTLIVSQLSIQKLYIIFLIITISITIYLIFNIFQSNSGFSLFCKIAIIITTALAINHYRNEIKKGIIKIKKICQDLLINLKINLFIYFIASFLLLLQLLCISGIINKYNQSFFVYIFLLAIFDWTYNVITGFVHSFIVYNVFTHNYKINYTNDTSESQRYPIFTFLQEIIVRSIEPSVFQFIPRTYAFFIEKFTSKDSNAEDSSLNQRLPKGHSNYFINLVFKCVNAYYRIYDCIHPRNENLFFYTIDQCIKTNSYELTDIKNVNNNIISVISVIRTWIIRFIMILISFSFLGFKEKDYFIEYKLFESLHNPLVFFKECTVNPSTSSCSFLITFFILIFFILSLESSYSASNSFFPLNIIKKAELEGESIYSKCNNLVTNFTPDFGKFNIFNKNTSNNEDAFIENLVVEKTEASKKIEENEFIKQPILTNENITEIHYLINYFKNHTIGIKDKKQLKYKISGLVSKGLKFYSDAINF